MRRQRAAAGASRVVRRRETCGMPRTPRSGTSSGSSPPTRSMRGADVLSSHTSAAVRQGLPLFRLTPRRVHVSGAALDGHVSSARGSSSRGSTCRRPIRRVIDGIRLHLAGAHRRRHGAVGRHPRRVCPSPTRLCASSPGTTRIARYDAGAAEDVRTRIRSRMRAACAVRAASDAVATCSISPTVERNCPARASVGCTSCELGFAVPRLQVAIARARWRALLRRLRPRRCERVGRVRR